MAFDLLGNLVTALEMAQEGGVGDGLQGGMGFLPGAQNMVMGAGQPAATAAAGQAQPGFWSKLGSFAKNQPNQFALGLTTLGEAINPTPAATKARQMVQGKIMSDRLDARRQARDRQNNQLTNMLSQALGGGLTPPEQPGPSQWSLNQTPKGSTFKLNFTPANGQTQLPPVQTSAGFAANPPGPTGGYGAGIPARPAVGGPPVNPHWPSPWNNLY